MIKYFKPSLLGVIMLFLSCQADKSVSKPELFEFGASQQEMMEKMTPYCTSVEARTITPIQLPTATVAQTQLDCEGFLFEGKKRKAELVFADDQLDLVWILTEADEEEKWIADFTKQFGTPTHQMEEVTFFLDDGVAVRNQPHEVLFLSDRLQEPYRQWLSKQ